MFLYRVNRGTFYWAQDNNTARRLFRQDHGVPARECERVWASNNDPRYKGYVYQEVESE